MELAHQVEQVDNLFRDANIIICASSTSTHNASHPLPPRGRIGVLLDSRILDVGRLDPRLAQSLQTIQQDDVPAGLV